MLDNYIGKDHLLTTAALFKAALHDAAAMLVGADLLTMSHTGFKDELSVSRADLSSSNVRISRLLT